MKIELNEGATWTVVAIVAGAVLAIALLTDTLREQKRGCKCQPAEARSEITNRLHMTERHWTTNGWLVEFSNGVNGPASVVLMNNGNIIERRSVLQAEAPAKP